jgi:hypothetical protein
VLTVGKQLEEIGGHPANAKTKTEMKVFYQIFCGLNELEIFDT